MGPEEDSDKALSSLYEALEVPQIGLIYCFALIEQNGRCLKTVPNVRRKYIDTTVQTLAVHVSSDEDEPALEEISESLTQLTEKLICHRPPKPHTRKPTLQGEICSNPRGYVHALLTSRFHKWQSRRRIEEIPNRPLKDSQITPKSRKAPGRYRTNITDNEDEEDYTDNWKDKHDDTEGRSEEEEEGEPITKTSSEARNRASPQRPQLVREIPVTPARGQGSRSRNRYFSASGSSEEPVRPPSSLSVMEDAFGLSPESVTSPDPSDIFTLSSAASTPFSIISTIGYESRRASLRNGSRERHEESPTRKTGFTDETSNSRDMRCRMKLSEDDLGDECQEVKPDRAPLQSPLSRRLMTFRHKEKLPVHNIIDCLMERRRESKPGFVYCFAEQSAPGYLKIGSTVSCDGNGVATRLRDWTNKCDHNLVLKFTSFMSCSVKRMELLIHRTLHKENRVASCPELVCTKRHREWFEISEDEARSIVEIWRQFSELTPYDALGYLKREWSEYASGLRKQDIATPAKRWLKTDLVGLMAKTTEKSDKDKLWHVLAQIREKKRTIERQLLEAEQDEERIQKMLSELKIGHEGRERK